MMKVVVLNDTSRECHHGCDRVMDNLYANLYAWKADVIHVSYLNDNLASMQLEKCLDQCDVALINGEGTIHHGNPYAEALLKVVSRSKARRKYLINSTYQENPAAYKEYLDQFNGVYVRDSMSKQELLSIDIDSEVVPDLTFFNMPEKLRNAERSGAIVGCSVDRKTAIALYDLRYKLAAARPLSIFRKANSPLKRLKEIRQSIAAKDLRAPKFFLEISLARLWFTSNACDSHEDYARSIASSNLVLSGRYHTVCMAMQNEIPFLATASNTFKVDALLADSGLASRMIRTEELDVMDEVKISNFSDGELQRLRIYNCVARKKIESMFQNIFCNENNG